MPGDGDEGGEGGTPPPIQPGDILKPIGGKISGMKITEGVNIFARDVNARVFNNENELSKISMSIGDISGTLDTILAKVAKLDKIERDMADFKTTVRDEMATSTNSGLKSVILVLSSQLDELRHDSFSAVDTLREQINEKLESKFVDMSLAGADRNSKKCTSLVKEKLANLGSERSVPNLGDLNKGVVTSEHKYSPTSNRQLFNSVGREEMSFSGNNTNIEYVVDGNEYVCANDGSVDNVLDYGMAKTPQFRQNFKLPIEQNFQIFSNAIEINFDTDAQRMFEILPRISRKHYDAGVPAHKIAEYSERRGKDLATLSKDFIANNMIETFDEWIRNFWRLCVRLCIESPVDIKFCAYERLDVSSKLICGDNLEPDKCSNMSVYLYFGKLRRAILPLNDISSARLAYQSFKQNSLALDVFFEKKLNLFKRCFDKDIRTNDYLDFYQQLCKDLSNKSLANDARKIKKIDLTDTNGFRKELIDLGQCIYEGILCHQIDDEQDVTLCTQGMLNNLNINLDTNDKVVAQTDESNYEYDNSEEFWNNENQYSQKFPTDFERTVSNDEIVYDPNSIEHSVCAAQNDKGKCFYCFSDQHLLRDCDKLMRKEPPHPNSMYSPQNLKSQSDRPFITSNNNNSQFRKQNTTFSQNNAYRPNRGYYSNSSNNKGARSNFKRGASNAYPRGGYRGSYTFSPSYNRRPYPNYNNNKNSTNQVSINDDKNESNLVEPNTIGQLVNEDEILIKSLTDWGF